MINSLSIVIPLFNEERRLKYSFHNIKKLIKNKKIEKIEIIFVDDGSTDKSKQIIYNFIKNLDKSVDAQLINVKKNLGKGHALRKGFLASKNEWVLTSDVDFSVPIICLLNWINKSYISQKFDIYFGSRALKKSYVISSKHRIFLGKIYRYLILLFFKINIKDTQCGFKLYKRKKTRSIFLNLTRFEFDHDLEIALLARKKNIKIKELPVTWKHTSDSKVNVIKDSLKMFFGIFILFFRN